MNVSASGQQRWLECSPSGFLSSVSQSNEWAARGTDGHQFLEYIGLGVPREEALKKCDQEHLQLYQAIDTDSLFAGFTSLSPEVAYALNFETRKVRKIGQSIGRNYGHLDKMEMAGSCDLIATDLDGRTVHIDWKFGKHSGAKSLQQMFFSACLYLLGVENVESRVVAIEAEGPNIGRHEVFSAEIGPFEIEEYLDRMLAAAKRSESEEERWLQTGSARVKVGEWCDYCPVKASGACPAYAGLAKAMVADLTTLADRVAALTPEQAGVAWLKYREAESLIEIIGKSLKGYCGDGSIPLPDGREVRAQTQSRSSLNKDALLELAIRLGASAEDINGAYRKVSFPVYKIRSKKDSPE